MDVGKLRGIQIENLQGRSGDGGRGVSAGSCRMQRIIPNGAFVGRGGREDEWFPPPNADPARNRAVGDHSSSPGEIWDAQPASHDTGTHNGSDDGPDGNSDSRDSDADDHTDAHADGDADSDADVDSDAHQGDHDTDASRISVRRLLLVELQRFDNLHLSRRPAHDLSCK